MRKVIEKLGFYFAFALLLGVFVAAYCIVAGGQNSER
jgi:hypothetical protein